MTKIMIYYIDICPACAHGIVCVLKEPIIKKLFLWCDECDCEWITAPDNISWNNNLLQDEKYKHGVPANFEDIVEHNWTKYVKGKSFVIWKKPP